MKHYATSSKIAGSRPDEVNVFILSIFLILPAALGPEIYSAVIEMGMSSRKLMFQTSSARPLRKVDNLTAICEPCV
jgi:hypothetical protein